ncbi:hypothetical protein HHU12_30780 [Flammeovirga aprica JL-4]|uniref:Uncharacterized protein n=2 Tax=Flammeovirga aprica TaxID=29528 RepID=A0A7X9XD15_9BACT|nr:hypothetical protein [Flammeovirga aprica JL-4]
MKQTFKIFFHILLIIFLTAITQIGGIVYLLFLVVLYFLKTKNILLKVGVFSMIYLFFIYVIVPPIARWQGREPVVTTESISPTNYMTVLLNRNYVVPEMNNLLLKAGKQLKGTNIKIKYLDACFPFVKGFPLLPHLSHNDGRKIDLSLVYENQEKKITDLQKSISGYGVYEEVKKGEWDQPTKCLEAGNFQYDFPKYLTFGSINKELKFSNNGNKKLISILLAQPNLGKLFIEPHLKNRLNLNHPKVRFHGCRAVRHDDHIHIQL